MPDTGSKTDASSVLMRVEESLNGPHFLRTLFRLLDESDVRYCVLHSWERLPEEVPSDLDMAVHPQDEPKLSSVFQGLWRKGFTPFQCFNYFTNANYLVFYWFEDVTLKTAAIDIILEHRRSGMIVPTSEELLANRRRHGTFWVSSPETQFAYLLAKQAWKGKASLIQALRLQCLVEQLGQEKSERIAGRIFRKHWKHLVIASCTNGSLNKVLKKVRSQPWRTSLLRDPLRLGRYLVDDGRRILRRWFQPTGIMVSVLGPDGVGKSTLIERIGQAFDRGFRRRRLFHWRPELLAPQRETATVPNPHASPLRGPLMSMLYLGAFLADYWVGYLFVIRPLLARSTLVVFDRYFHDLLVDPRRYRYGGPKWLPQFFSRLVPLPDLVLVLDAGEQVIFARKGEVRTAEVRRQREAYRQLNFGCTPTVFVNTEQSLDRTLYDSTRALAEIMAQRFDQRRNEWAAVAT